MVIAAIQDNEEATMSVSTDVTRALLADGVMVTVRELGPADHDQVVALHRAMPEEDRYLRFFSAGLPPMDTFVNRITSPTRTTTARSASTKATPCWEWPCTS
ncbi:hypothetical protein GCM10029964_053510 [Kibdelosporangium lantanae]